MTLITLTDGTRQSFPAGPSLRGSNCGIPGVFRLESGRSGPNVVITALIHGNEVCGAHALWRLLQEPFVPQRGCLTLVFCNLDAYALLDDATKGDRRFVDEDLNRVWGRLNSAGDSCELQRAREIRAVVCAADVLLDLHSMTSPAQALGLVGLAWKNVDFARRIGFPSLLVRDAGHAAGSRLIDHPRYVDAGTAPVAMLLECGEHFSRAALDAAEEAVKRTIAVFLNDENPAPISPQTVIEVTQAVTIETDSFEFTREWQNMEIVTDADTLIGRDGDREVRTPYDSAYLVMPASSMFRKPGQTAVRLARRVDTQHL